jgi:glycosyltransferase involved in cell wall biosynthesis
MMLSILIPTYSYNVYPLVSELNGQCQTCGIEYEIIVLDDNSKKIFLENEEIKALENCKFLVNQKNLGRGVNINKLVELSKFENVLILEADAFPSKKNYIQLYVDALKKKPQAVFGGVIYSEKKPSQNTLLRWIYGHARESKSLNYRLQHPNDIVFSWNLMIQKKIFIANAFDTSITTYGFEDLVFLKKLKQQKVAITQIDNPCMHQNEELSTIFIEKSKTAVRNLVDLHQRKILSAEDSGLIRAFEKIEKWRLTALKAFFFKKFENAMIKNLLSEKPSLFVFDLYRLGYFCKIIRLKNITK